MSVRAVRLTARGERLAAHLVSSAEEFTGSLGVVFFHGLGSSQESYLARAVALAERVGAGCLTFDLSGHGRSSGSLESISPADHLLECLVAVDAIRSFFPTVREVGLCGASYGAYLACQVALSRPVESLALRAPALLDDEFFDEPYSVWHSQDTPRQASRFLAAIGAIGARAVVVESEFDEEVPHFIIAQYLEALNGAEHVVLPGATHALVRPQWDALFVEHLVRWFSSPS